MKAYLFSIFVRSFLAFSGFLVFILTAYLYGAEGRGVIGYGTSLFAIFGSLLSFNLGRGFLAETIKENEKKKALIGSFLTLNFCLGLLASAGGILYWYFSPAARQMLTERQALLFAMTGLFYIWSTNGNFFFSSFLKTSLQEMVILTVRILLILFLGILVLFKNRQLDLFICSYAFVLFAGVLVEIFFLLQISDESLFHRFRFSVFKKIISKSFVHHVDYLAFNIFPLVLTVVCASYISKSDVGRVNFAIQIINFVFLLAVTANIRLMAYISDSGFRVHLSRYKKLFAFTLGASAIAVGVIYFCLNVSLVKFHFQQFEGVAKLFLISALAIPGYLSYQFLTPIWIELKKEKTLAILHSTNFFVSLMITPIILKSYETDGVMIVFAIFHLGVFLIQTAMFLNNFILKQVAAEAR